MKSYAIVLAGGALALAATSLIELISMWGPLVLMSTLMALVTVWIIRAERTKHGCTSPSRRLRDTARARVRERGPEKVKRPSGSSREA